MSSTWHTLLKSEIFQKKAKSLFQDEILIDQVLLHRASGKGDIDVVRELASYGMLDLNHKLEFCPFIGLRHVINTTPWSAAAHEEQLDVEQILLERGAVSDQTCKELWKAAKEVNMEEVKRLLSNLLSIDGWNEYWSRTAGTHEHWETPLQVASENGHKHVVEILLQNGAAPYKWCQCGLTPLQYAILIMAIQNWRRLGMNEDPYMTLGPAKEWQISVTAGLRRHQILKL